MKIVGALEAAITWMYEHCDVVVFTGDWHSYEDEEIDPENPDPQKGTYPPHCMGRSHDPRERVGAQIIPEIRPKNPLFLEIGASDERARALAARAVSRNRPIFIQKNRFDVFEGNQATESLIQGLANALERPLEFYVVGVARDVCVTQAVDGMQARGFRVTALKDATWGLGLEPEEETLARWAKTGRVISVAELTR
jgi:nicotinamidase-related amidase